MFNVSYFVHFLASQGLRIPMVYFFYYILSRGSNKQKAYKKYWKKALKKSFRWELHLILKQTMILKWTD